MSMLVETERCTGQCCRHFTLSGLGPGEVAVAYAVGQGWLDPSDDDRLFQDFQVVGSMLVWLGAFRDWPSFVPMDQRTRQHFTPPDAPPDHGGQWWTCRHLVEGRDCSIYEQRPRMCRDFPYDGECPWPGCTRKVRPEGVTQ